jgi:hypothetical protein
VNVDGQGLWDVVAVTHLNEDGLSGHTKDRWKPVAMIHRVLISLEIHSFMIVYI